MDLAELAMAALFFSAGMLVGSILAATLARFFYRRKVRETRRRVFQAVTLALLFLALQAQKRR